MKFKCFTSWEQLPKSADALFSQAEKDSLFFSRPWFENLISTALRADQNMLLVCVVEDGAETENILAILPLIKYKNCKGKAEWSSLHHIYTSLYTLLLVENNQQEIINCLAKGLSQLPFDSLTLEPIAKEDDNINSLQQALESLGLSCSRYAQFFNWFHPVQEQTFADYMEARPSKVRNTIARKQRKLEREHSYEIKMHKGCDVPQAMADFNTVYEASWKRKERFGNVVKGLTDTFSKLGWIRLAILYIEGQPVAAQIWFVVHKKASIYKLAYDEAWKQYSTGSILTRYLMEYVIDTDKVDEIDFLTGNDHYKQDWMQERRQRRRLVFIRKTDSKEGGNLLTGLLTRLFKNG